MDPAPAELDFYFRLVLTFFFLIIAIIVFLMFVYRSMRRARRDADESAEYAWLVVEARETERSRIARELHDTIAGGLRRLGFLLYQDEDPQGVQNTAGEAAAYCNTLIKETRDICQSLYPPDFSRLPFAASLQDLCLRFEEHSGVPCVFSVPQDALDALSMLPVETRFQCFRIIQEAFANIEKHARAHEASLVIRRAEKGLLFICSDDGVGLPLEISGGLGIRGMRDRAKLAGGELVIESSPEMGVMLTLHVPLPDEEPIDKMSGGAFYKPVFP